MILVLSYAPVVEEILVKKIQKYLEEDCKWENLYPNFPVVRINNEYPWVPYMSDGWPDLSNVSETLFPSVTIVTSQDTKSPQKFVSVLNTTLDKTEFEDFKTQVAENGYIIAPEAIAEMETYFNNNDVLYGTEVCYQKRDTINIDITTDDSTNIKNRIYDLINLYLVGPGANELYKEKTISIIEGSLDGTRSGTYNIDFGRVLRGASIQCEVDYVISQIFYNTDTEAIDDVVIEHTVSVKGGQSG
jgi:hypothetical protein